MITPHVAISALGAIDVFHAPLLTKDTAYHPRS
jgi:hypothetical protein